VSNSADIVSITSASTAALQPGPQLDMVSTSDDSREQQSSQVDPRAHGAVSAAMAALAGGAGPLAHARSMAGTRINSPASEMKPWGSPMDAPPEPAPTASRTTDDNGSSWGRNATITIADSIARPQTLARVTLDRGEPLTLTIAINTPATPGVQSDKTVPGYIWARIDVGGGSASMTRVAKVGDLLIVPVSASYIQIAAYMGDGDGQPLDPATLTTLPGSAQVSAFVSRGVRGTPGIATTFSSQVGSSFGMGGPQSIASIEAHLTAPAMADQFLQLYDGTSDEAPMVAEYALGTTPAESSIGSGARLPNTQQFAAGLYIVISSTSGYPTASGAEAFVAVERVLL
jgi:hypothetical protein